MGNVTSSWLIGSARIPEQTVTIDGTDYTWPEGYYYLRHTTTQLSMVGTLQSILSDHGVAGASVVVLKNRKVRVSFTAGNEFTMDWPSPLLKALFGFQTDIGGSPSQIAEKISPLLWSPGQTESSQLAALGVLGQEISDAKIQTSPTGMQTVDYHYIQTINTFEWSYVALDRFQTPLNVGGEWTKFFKTVFWAGQKCYLYRNIVEDSASTDPVTWTQFPLGPYGIRAGSSSKGLTWTYKRSKGRDSVDTYNEVSLDVLVVPEWGVL